MRRILLFLVGLALSGFGLSSRAASPAASSGAEADPKLFRAGACVIDVSPAAFPVLVNGGFLQGQATRLNDPVHAKCIVLDDGATAEIVSNPLDGVWVVARFLSSPTDPARVGSEEMIFAQDVVEISETQ